MIRKAKASDIDKIMQIWLESNTKAHAFIAPVYWQKHFDEVKNNYLPQAETFVFELFNLFGFCEEFPKNLLYT